MKNKNILLSAICFMAAVSKGYGVGDTVYVWYKDSVTLEATPQSRVVSDVRVLDSGNVAEVSFTNGDKILDGATTAQRVFTTQALCATAIISAAILRYDATAQLDATTSAASTAGQPTLGLCRSSA